MGVYTHSESNWVSRRGPFLVILVVFHLALFWALKSGLAVKFIKSITEPIKAEIINEVKPEEPPPPPPEIKIELPPVQVPPVLVDIPNPPDPPPTALIVETTTQPVPPAPPSPPAPTTRPSTKVGGKPIFVPDPADYYPSASISLKEEGNIKVRMCVSTSGQVTEVSVLEPSKYDRLNEAALKLAKKYRFKPATIDGKPVEDCYSLPVKFNVKDVSQ